MRLLALAAGTGGAGPDESWLKLDLDMAALAGRWIELIYEVPFSEDTARPVLRFVLQEGHEDLLLSAASGGRGIWRGLVPGDAREIHVSPVDFAGPHRFRIAALRRLGLVAALTGVVDFYAGCQGLRLIRQGQLREGLRVLRRSARSTALEDYPRWKAARSRAPEPARFDAPLAPDLPALHWLSETSAGTLVTAALAGMGPDDLVAPRRRGEVWAPETELVLRSVAARDDADLFYADEETPGPAGARPWLKPGWSPVLAQSIDLIGSAWVARVRHLRAIWGEVPVAEILNRPLTPGPGLRVRHIDRVLLTAPRRARLTGPPPAPWLDRGLPAVSILLPTRDRVDLLRACIDSLPTAGCAFEMIVVDNGSAEPATLTYLTELAQRPQTRVLSCPGPFNYSQLCNDAAETARGEALIFLNNDTVGLAEGWAAKLAAWSDAPDLGAIGARLLFPDGRLQHNGVVIGIDGHCNHFDSHLPGDALGYFERFDVPFEVSAVTGACLAVNRSKFAAVGGYDAVHLPVEFSDIDLCLRLDERGWRSLVEPRAVLIHHESATRKISADQERRYAPQVAWFRQRWQSRIRRDPFFHSALALNSHRARLG